MSVRGSPVKIFSGNANLELAQGISTILGIPLSKAKVGKFSNGETMVEIEVRKKIYFFVFDFFNRNQLAIVTFL